MNFGSKEFFKNYILNQMRKEEKGLEVIHRVHFAMTSIIFEMFNGKDALVMLKNLTEVCDELSTPKRGLFSHV